jgi:hypothetical protein
MAVLVALGTSLFVALGIVAGTQLGRQRPVLAALGAVPLAVAIFIAVAWLWAFSLGL